MDFKQWCVNNKNIKKLVKDMNSSIPEQYVGFYIDKALDGNVEYAKQFEWLDKMSLDIYIPMFNLAIEYDGEYYHSKRESTDKNKDSLCSKNGVDIIRICERREYSGETNNPNKIFYYFKNKYSNIDIVLTDLQTLLNNKYQTTIEFDVNLKRDTDAIIEYVQNKYYKRTIAYNWPETLYYWMYEKNKRTPFDVFVTDDKVYKLKCPYCGKEYSMYMRYRHNKKSVSPCECELENIDKQYHSFINDYKINKNNILLDDTLLSRRVYDRIMVGVNYPSLSTDEEKLIYKELGLM